jgi:YVTN family beta-propeller protein
MSSSKAASSPGVGGGRVLWVVGALSFGLVAVVLVGLFVGLATSNLPTPKAVATLHLVKDVSLPTAAIAPAGHAPIQSLPADGFDFQALDPRTGLLFITHAGPSANKQALIRNQLPAGTRFQSQLVVFDTKKQAVIGHIAIRNVHGVTVAPDLGRAYAADVTDHQVYVIDEHSLRVIATIQLGLLPCSFAPCETPDALEYDAVDHKLFISGNGTDNAHQDISVIDTRTNLFSGLIPLGQDQFGDSVGHPQYDASSHRLYVAVQPQPQPAPAVPTPAPGTPAPTPAPVVFPAAQFLTIDPVSLQVLGRVAFNPHTCTDPHGLVVDPVQHVAFTACTVTRTLMMIDLQSMKLSGPWPVVLKPDILRLDQGLHRLYVPGSSGVSIFDEQAAAKGTVKKIGDFVVSKGTSHTMAFNPSTHLLYFAVQDNQGHAVERIEQNP